VIHDTTRNLLTVLAELYNDGALLDVYGIDIGDFDADPEDLAPLDRAMRDWIDVGAPDADEEETP